MAQRQSIEHRTLGRNGISVSAIGLGCMSLSGVYGKSDDPASVALLNHALDQGVDFWDSSDMYGWGHNEEVLAQVPFATAAEIDAEEPTMDATA